MEQGGILDALVMISPHTVVIVLYLFRCIGTHTTVGLTEKGRIYWDTYHCRIGGKGQDVLGHIPL